MSLKLTELIAWGLHADSHPWDSPVSPGTLRCCGMVLPLLKIMSWQLRTGARPQSSSVTSEPVSFWALCECGAPRGPSVPEVWGDSLENPPSFFWALHLDTALCKLEQQRCLGLIKGSSTLGAVGGFGLR